MGWSRALVAAVVAAGLLTGCASRADVASTPAPTPTPAATASSTPTPTPPTPALVVVSVDQVSVVDATGATMTSAPWADPEAVLALLGSLEGYTPEPVDTQKGGLLWEWSDVRMFNRTFALVQFRGAQIGGLPVQTSQGIHVGSTRAELEALDPYDWNAGTGSGAASDHFCLEVRPEPGRQSIMNRDMEGITCVGVRLDADTVIEINSMENDWTDV